MNPDSPLISHSHDPVHDIDTFPLPTDLFAPTTESLDQATYLAAIRRSVENVIVQRKRPRIVIDFSNAASINSAILGMLGPLYKAVTERGGRVVLCGISIQLRDVFEITHLDQVFTIYPDSAAAAEALAAE